MAVRIDTGSDEEVKGDMTPMIDVIFLLLIFFILTTAFIDGEKVIGSLLPTDKGPGPGPFEERDVVSVCIYPAGLEGTTGIEALDRRWRQEGDSLRQRAAVKVGANGEVLEMDGARLMSADPQCSGDELERLGAHLRRELSRREQTVDQRKEQFPVEIHCFSGLPWKYALVAYDAVRVYESEHRPGLRSEGQWRPEVLDASREVDFAPPRIRHFVTWEWGNELFEIMHRR